MQLKKQLQVFQAKNASLDQKHSQDVTNAKALIKQLEQASEQIQ